MRSLIIVISLSAAVAASAASPSITPVRPVNTYSIVAYDSATGEFGAAVQSHWFKVADVIWAEPGIGVVATQSLADFRYGPLGLEMMAYGKSAQQALDGIMASDQTPGVRQVAMIDRDGNIATHTGERCIAEAGHRQGRVGSIAYSVQANLMRHYTVWDAMAGAFESAAGDLAERMMVALEAAEAAGGDIRGKQSAAMVVVTGEPTGQPWQDRTVDIRVDDSPEPLPELRRLLEVTRAYDYMNRGDELLGEDRIDEAQEAYAHAAELAPGNLEIQFWNAATLVTVNHVDRALPIFAEVFAADESWRELIPRLVASDLLPDNPDIINRILEQ